MWTRHMTRSLLSIALAAVVATILVGFPPASPAAFARTAPPSPAPAPEQMAAVADAAWARQAQLRIVWQMINRHYVYGDFRGLDWRAVRARYEPLALAAPDDASFYRLLGEMVAELDDGHTRYLSPEAAGEADALADGTYSYPGVGILTVSRPEALVVLEVLPGSPADAAGLRRRDQVVAVDGHPWSLECGRPCAVRGPEGSSVRLTVRSADGPPRDVSVLRAPVHALLAVSAARLAADPAIGYLRIPTFQAPTVAAEVEAELRTLLADGPLAGLVIDVRRNGGGRRAMLLGVLGQLVEGEHGEFFSRRRTTPLLVAAGPLREALAEVPVAVLVDERTASAAEVLAGVLQAAGRACVVGSGTAGNVELVYSYNLDDGSRLLLAREGLRLRDGAILDGRGVMPDRVVVEDWALYGEADDPYLVAARGALAAGGCGPRGEL